MHIVAARTLLLLALLLIPSADAMSARKPIRTGMLERVERDAGPPRKVSAHDVGEIARAWILAGRRDRARRWVRELVGRGTLAYGLGQPFTPFQPINTQPYPADALYTAILVPVAATFRMAGRPYDEAVNLLLSRIGLVNGCFAYDDQRPDLGCVHNVNAVALSFLSSLDRPFLEPIYQAALQTERSEIMPSGAWWYWEDAPPEYLRLNDLTHQAGSVWWLLISPDSAVRAIGAAGARYVRANFTPKIRRMAPADRPGAFLSLAALVAAGDKGACRLIDRIPGWERRWNRPIGEEPDGAFYYIWAQKRCGRYAPKQHRAKRSDRP